MPREIDAVELLEPLVDPRPGLGVHEATISAFGARYSTVDALEDMQRVLDELSWHEARFRGLPAPGRRRTV